MSSTKQDTKVPEIRWSDVPDFYWGQLTATAGVFTVMRSGYRLTDFWTVGA